MGGSTGYLDGTFRPSEDITREHAAKIYGDMGLFDELLPEADASDVDDLFTDITSDHRYAEQIAAVAKKGIFTGDSTGEGTLFDPKGTMQRKHMAKNVVELFGLEDTGEEVDGLNLEVVPEEYHEYVTILAQHGVTTELDDFRANDTLTRAQFATFLHRAYEAQQDAVVESVSAINETGVEVSFPELTKDHLGYTVEVKDADGKVYEVKEADLAEGLTSYVFEFETSVDSNDLIGVWTVDGVSFDLDLANNLEAFSSATNQLELNEALTDLGIENVDSENAKAYFEGKTKFLNDLEEDLTFEAVQAYVDEVNTSELSLEESKAIAKTVLDAEDAGNDVELADALSNPAFLRVNSDWILTDTNGYKDKIAAGDDTVEKIQDKIDSANDTLLADSDVAPITGVDKSKLLASKSLFETYATPDEDGEVEKETEKTLAKIQIQLALVDVLAATTPNNLKVQMTKLAELVDDDSTLDMDDYVDANGQAYIDALDDETDVAEKDEVSEIVGILFGDDTGVNDQEAAELVEAVNDVVTAAGDVDGDALLSALNDLGLKQVAESNKEQYVGDATEFATNSDNDKTKSDVQDQVNTSNVAAVNGAEKDSVIEALNVLELDNVNEANAEQYAAKNNFTVDGAQDEVDAINKSVIEAAQVKVINEAKNVAEVKSALDELADVGEVQDYLKVRSVDRDFVAAYVLDKRDDETDKEYANVDAIDTQVGTAVTTEHKDALKAVNNIEVSTSIDVIVDALEGTLDENFMDLSNTEKVGAAEAFYAELDFKAAGTIERPFVTIAAVKSLLN